MDSVLVWIILFTVLGGALSVVAAATFLVLPGGIQAKLLPSLVSFAIGTLLGAAFLGLLPHALESAFVTGAHKITLAVLLGLLLFFLLEKMVLWRHCHSNHCEAHTPISESVRDMAAGRLILIGDGIHNLIDGVLIAAAFLTDFHLGVVTSLAVIAHEIPQEVGDFAILLQGGFSRGRAFLYNVLVSLTTVIGGVAAFYSLSLTEQAVPYVLALSAASFIYIATADLIPNLHRRTSLRASMRQTALLLLGIATIALLRAGHGG